MKKIFITKDLWRELCRVKNKQDFSNYSESINFLIQHAKEPHVEKSHDGIIKEIEERINSRAERHIGTPLELPLPDNIVFLCLMCGQSYTVKKEDHDAVEGVKCHHCGHFHLIQVFSWLPQDTEIEK